MVKDLCFEITDACLNDCDKNTTISYEDFKRVIDYFIKTGGIEELSISGGEPFLHPELLKMIGYARSKNIRTIIFTSGVVVKKKFNEEQVKEIETEMNKMLNEAKKNEPWNTRLLKYINEHYQNLMNSKEYSQISIEVLKKLKEMGLNKIVFDFQAYELETDNYLMGRGQESRQALFNSILMAKYVGLNVDINFIPMKSNYKEIKEILELLEIAGVDNISILNFVPQGRENIYKSKLMLTEEELKEFFELLEEGKERYSGNVRIGIPLQGENSHKCNAGLEKIYIKFDGTILPCQAFKELTLEEAKKYNIKLFNIYENLEDVQIPGRGTKKEPLCKVVYKNR